MNSCPELNRTFAKLKEGLKEKSVEVVARCEEAMTLRNDVKSANQTPLPASHINGVLNEAALELPDRVQNLNQAKQAKENFRIEHNLGRDAISPNTVMTFLILWLQVFVEGAVNSSYLVSAHLVGGPLSALLISLTISFTNIVVSAAAGFYIGRYLNYGCAAIDSDAPEFLVVRRRAKLKFCAYVAAIALLHISVGLIRATESLDILDHSLANYIKILTTPEALFLVLVGIVMSVLAYSKSLNGFDDPYPNYGNYQRAVEHAINSLHECYEASIESIEDIFDEAEEKIAANNAANHEAIENYNAGVSRCQSAKREYDHHVSLAQSEFTKQARRILSTRSAISGKQDDSADQMMQQFSFTDLIKTDLPKPLTSTDDTKHSEKLEKAKADVLQKLSDLFEKNLNA